MIVSFKQKWLEDFWNNGKQKKVPPNLQDRLIRKLDMLNSVKELNDLRSPPSNRLHSLHGDRKGQYAINVNGPWRLCFIFDKNDIFEVELVQYH